MWGIACWNCLLPSRNHSKTHFRILLGGWEEMTYIETFKSVSAPRSGCTSPSDLVKDYYINFVFFLRCTAICCLNHPWGLARVMHVQSNQYQFYIPVMISDAIAWRPVRALTHWCMLLAINYSIGVAFTI